MGEDYFEEHPHDYNPDRLNVAARWISRLCRDGDELFDVGCGSGRVLLAMREAGVARLSGCDTAMSALERAKGRVGFTAHRGSILDEGFVSGLGTYRFVTMAAVLHHLVGRSRVESRDNAIRAVANSLRLVEPGGRLVIMEPTYRPAWAMAALFWIKRCLIRLFGNRRIELGDWNNLGAPLVSYYTPRQVAEIVAAAGGTVRRQRDKPTRVRRLPRLLGIRGRWSSTLMVVPEPGPHPDNNLIY